MCWIECMKMDSGAGSQFMKFVQVMWAVSLIAAVVFFLQVGYAGEAVSPKVWEQANPIVPLPKPPLGVTKSLEDLPEPPTPQRVRLGRWLFFDTRLSVDGTVSCATCHRPEHGFSEPTPVSTGVEGKQGDRKAPPILNLAWTVYPHFFWDGRAASLEDQAKGPMTNSVEMANADHDLVVSRIAAVPGYGLYFKEAFGDDRVTIDRIAHAIADYERTRFSGNSPWDRWMANLTEHDHQQMQIPFETDHDSDDDPYADPYGEAGEDIKDQPEYPSFKDGPHVSAQVKLGHWLFNGKAACNQCHLGFNFTDQQFHNLGVGWDVETGMFKDIGRYAVTQDKIDLGAFKTPTLRDLANRAPYMHDGSHNNLREVIDLYNRGGDQNPQLSPKIKPLNLTDTEMDALVALMDALNGEGYQDKPPAAYPQ